MRKKRWLRWFSIKRQIIFWIALPDNSPTEYAIILHNRIIVAAAGKIEAIRAYEEARRELIFKTQQEVRRMRNLQEHEIFIRRNEAVLPHESKVIKSCTAIGKKEQLLCALSKGGEKRIFIG